METNKRSFKDFQEYRDHKLCLDTQKLIKEREITVKDEVLINTTSFVVIILIVLTFTLI